MSLEETKNKVRAHLNREFNSEPYVDITAPSQQAVSYLSRN